MREGACGFSSLVTVNDMKDYQRDFNHTLNVGSVLHSADLGHLTEFYLTLMYPINIAYNAR